MREGEDDADNTGEGLITGEVDAEVSESVLVDSERKYSCNEFSDDVSNDLNERPYMNT